MGDSGSGLGRHTNVPNGLWGAWEDVRRRARNALTDEAPQGEELMELPEDQGMLDSWGEVTQLTYQQRLLGFFMVLGMGLLFLFIAFSLAPTVALFPKKFAFFLTAGNIFCICATCLLVGVRYQLRSMFQASRFEVTCVYVLSLFLTLVAALWLKSSVMSLAAAVLQLICILWYSLSYIPYARHTIGWAVSYAMYIVRPIVSGVVTVLRSCIG